MGNANSKVGDLIPLPHFLKHSNNYSKESHHFAATASPGSAGLWNSVNWCPYFYVTLKTIFKTSFNKHLASKPQV